MKGIQRTEYSIAVAKHKTKQIGVVTLEVHFRGTYENKNDALLLLGCAWSASMEAAGFDPAKTLITMQTQGKMQ